MHYGTAPWRYPVWGLTAGLVALGGFLGYRAYENYRSYHQAADAAKTVTDEEEGTATDAPDTSDKG